MYKQIWVLLFGVFALALTNCTDADAENPPFCDWNSFEPRSYLDRPPTIDSIKNVTAVDSHVVVQVRCSEDYLSAEVRNYSDGRTNFASNFEETRNGVLQGVGEGVQWTISRIEGGFNVQASTDEPWQGRPELIEPQGVNVYPTSYANATLAGNGRYAWPEVDRIEWWDCGEESCKQNDFGELLLVEEKGDLALIDGGSPVDGPAFLIQKSTGRILGLCGGFQMAGGDPEKPCDFDYWEARI